MGYEARVTRSYGRPAAEVMAQAAEAAARLGGKPGKGHRPADGVVDAVFNKQVGKKSFMNRLQLTVQVTEGGPDRCALALLAFPVDPIGQKLLFGVVGEPARQALEVYCAELDARLPPAPGA